MTDNTLTAGPAAPLQSGPQPPGTGRADVEHPWHGFWRDLLGGGALRSFLAIVLALLIGSLLVIVTSEDVQAAAGYFFARPGDTLSAMWQVISGAYQSIWEGAIFSPRRGFEPLTSTLMWATPLISGGLGVAIGFRAGLFNIGGRGQMLIAALFVGFVGASLSMPPVVHMLVAIFAGIAGGAIFAGIAGWLKAQTGAHEVIVTIMLNYIAYYLVTYLLKTQPFQAENASGNPKAKPIPESAQLPDLIGNVDLGFVLAILAAVAYWFIMERTTLGFRIRAVGINQHAARTAGIHVERTIFYTLAISGAFFGLAGATQVLGRATSGYDPGVDAGIGFDAITVALLGANHPVGVVLAGLLFGMLKAGSFPMQIVEGIPIDIVSVIQGIIVLLIAAPPLVRAIFRLPVPTGISLLDRIRASRKHEADASPPADGSAASGARPDAHLDATRATDAVTDAVTDGATDAATDASTATATGTATATAPPPQPDAAESADGSDPDNDPSSPEVKP